MRALFGFIISLLSDETKCEPDTLLVLYKNWPRPPDKEACALFSLRYLLDPEIAIGGGRAITGQDWSDYC